MSKEGLNPVKVTFNENHSCDGLVYDETHDFTSAEDVVILQHEMQYNTHLERLITMQHSNDKSQTVKEPRPLHYTFYTEPNGKGMSRRMYREGMIWSEDYKETKRRVKHIALPHRIRRTVLYFLAKVRRALRGNKGPLPN